MRKLSHAKPKATICARGTCVTVFGEEAKIVTFVVVATIVLIAAAIVDKALRAM